MCNSDMEIEANPTMNLILRAQLDSMGDALALYMDILFSIVDCIKLTNCLSLSLLSAAFDTNYKHCTQLHISFQPFIRQAARI